ncbi:hypothetical protein W02_07800 [Nitrospira sp. KM1]|nr:hypothetical protein W02_07800 [Nitrospira sp. KM1]
MTAVALKQLVTASERVGRFSVMCFCTVGVTNAVRAGESASHTGSPKQRDQTGTINVILVTNACLSRSAMVGAVQVATESKTATLLECRVPSSSGKHMATGTGTDAVVIASSGHGPKVSYSGTHTIIGSIIGRLVANCVYEGLQRSSRWQHNLRPSKAR